MKWPTAIILAEHLVLLSLRIFTSYFPAVIKANVNDNADPIFLNLRMYKENSADYSYKNILFTVNLSLLPGKPINNNDSYHLIV